MKAIARVHDDNAQAVLELMEEKRKAERRVAEIAEQIVARTTNHRERWAQMDAYAKLKMATKALNSALHEAHQAGGVLPAAIEGDIPEKW